MLLLDVPFADFDASWLDDSAAASEPAESPSRHAVLLSPDEQRLLRRKISNRESARRCRMRKQRQLEKLRAESARLRSENHDIASATAALSDRSQLLRRENHRLRAESAILARRLAELRRLILLRQLLVVAAPLPRAPDHQR